MKHVFLCGKKCLNVALASGEGPAVGDLVIDDEEECYEVKNAHKLFFRGGVFMMCECAKYKDGKVAVSWRE